MIFDSGDFLMPLRSPRGAHGARVGLTLIEILVTLAIISILMGVAALSLSGIFPRMKLNEATNDITLAFKRARSEAIKYSAPASVEMVYSGPPSIKVYNSNSSTATLAFELNEKILLERVECPNSGQSVVYSAGSIQTRTLEFTPTGAISLNETAPFILRARHQSATGINDARYIIVRRSGLTQTYKKGDYDPSKACDP